MPYILICMCDNTSFDLKPVGTFVGGQQLINYKCKKCKREYSSHEAGTCRVCHAITYSRRMCERCYATCKANWKRVDWARVKGIKLAKEVDE